MPLIASANAGKHYIVSVPISDEKLHYKFGRK